MVLVAVIVILVFAAGSLAWFLRRRHASRALSSRVEPLPAGVKHLAATLSDLSDLELHLPAAQRAPTRRARLGLLLSHR